jgi:hypothetical protein
MARAFLIDAETRSITEIDFVGGYKEVQRLLGCRHFTTGSRPFNGSLEQGFDGLYASDDLLEDRDDPKHWYQIDADRNPPSSYPIAGRGLVHGTDEIGEDRDARISRDELTARVTFTKRKFRGFKVHPGGQTFELGSIKAVSLMQIELQAPIIEEE